MTTTQAAPIRAGDAVRHIKSGERWLVAAVDSMGSVYPAGYPETVANGDDVELIERCTDEAHAEMLYQCARSQGLGRRRSLALSQLTMAMGRGERIPPDITDTIIRGIKSDVERAELAIAHTTKSVMMMTSFWRGAPRWLSTDSAAALCQLGERIDRQHDAARALREMFAGKRSPSAGPRS